MSRTSLGRSLPTLLLTLLLVAGLGTGQALAQYGGEEEGQQATDQGMEGAAGMAQEQEATSEDAHAGHVHMPAAAPAKNFLSAESREALRRLTVQDFQGRMKPLDTLSREMVMKVTKRTHFDGWEPLDLYLSWMISPRYWFDQPVIAVRFPGLKDRLGVSQETKYVTPASLLDGQGQYLLGDEVEEALRTADRDRSKLQRKLLSFDERVNLVFMNFQRSTLRIYPQPEDEKNTWLAMDRLGEAMRMDPRFAEFQRADQTLFSALAAGDDGEIRAAATLVGALQDKYGHEVSVHDRALKAELVLNDYQPFVKIIPYYFLAWALMLSAYVLSLARRQGRAYTLKHPLYLIGSLVYWGTLLIHVSSFVLRWVASGRAPVSNGYESLIWISLMVGTAGFLFELKDRHALLASLGSLLTAIVLSVSLLSTFDPAIGPLVPVLASYWLNIHVTIITSSYGFLGLSGLMAMTILVLYLFKGPGRDTVQGAIGQLHRMHWYVLVTGLGLLSVGTLLGGVWANESWGRYWGWDAKETWSLVTILVYSAVTHMRFIRGVDGPWTMATASFLSLSAVIMTYFGVNYFLVGLHSYAAGDATKVPTWVIYAVIGALVLVLASWLVDRNRHWRTGAPA